MAFKLYSDQFGAKPILLCDVCQEPLLDIWSDLATATPTSGQTVDVTTYHKTCTPQSPGSVVMLMVDFLRLYAMKSGIGDVATDGVKDKMCFMFPVGAGFEVISHDGGV